MTSLNKKPPYKTLSVILDNGQTISIGRCALEKLDVLLEVQDRLLEKYIQEDGALGVLMNDSSFVADLELGCSVLPIVGKEEKYLSFADISESWEQLVVLWFNGSFDVEKREMNTITQPKISALHFLPYGKMLDEKLEQRRKNREESKKD